MRSGLFWKLFLLQLLAATAVLAGALLLSRSFSVRGFAEFLETHQRERVQQVASEIAEAYPETGDVVEAARSVRAFRKRTRRHMDPPHPGPHPPPGGEGAEREGMAGEHVERIERIEKHPAGDRRIILRRHMEAGIPPLQLQDVEGKFLLGDDRMLREERLREPITVDGNVVGYLAWPRFRGRHPEQAVFEHQQARHLAVIAPVALLIAAIFAAFITALIVRPIKKLSAGTAALARREFNTRLPESRGDELGQLAADFNRLAAALAAFDARQRQWLADIAHELRTPLAVLRGELEAVQEGVRTVGPGLVTSLRQETSRLESLVEDLHLVSLAESGGLRLHRADADIGELAQQAAERFRKPLRDEGFELALAITPGLHASVDVQRLDQVLANLLRNALAHAAPGTVTVATRSESAVGAASAATGFVVVTVADSGPGVPDDALPKLFDRLYRVESARTRKVGGAGLGLSICKSIVEAHGGTIAAQKSAAGGLEIVMRLPVVGGPPVGGASAPTGQG
jgi:two-component system sensor histidine kinase BaeS